MDFLQRMNNALDYIESNLEGDVNYKITADLAFCSVSYFQRMFSLLTDITLSEYIRRRRMTLAAFELQNKNVKIIDLAIKYGYESPDFQSSHGVMPSIARNKGISLKAYPCLTFHISIKGDVEMNYRIESKEEFRIVGVKRSFQGPSDDESVVPLFWDEIYSNGCFQEMLKISTGTPKGVHGFIRVFDESKVDYTIACLSDKEPPEGMVSQVIPKSTWAIFELGGPVNTAMAEAWKRIFSEWLPASNYEYAETVDIECFPYYGDKRASDFKFEIWLPIIEKIKK